jgi:hypothetical protein
MFNLAWTQETNTAAKSPTPLRGTSFHCTETPVPYFSVLEVSFPIQKEV